MNNSANYMKLRKMTCVPSKEKVTEVSLGVTMVKYNKNMVVGYGMLE